MTQTTTTASSTAVTPVLLPGNVTRVTDDAILVGKWSTAITVDTSSTFTATPGANGTIMVQLSNDGGVTWRNAFASPSSVAVTSGVSPSATRIRATATVATGTLVVDTPQVTYYSSTSGGGDTIFSSGALTASGLIKTGAARVYNLLVTASAAGVLTLRDGVTISGAALTGYTNVSVGAELTLNVPYSPSTPPTDAASGLYAELVSGTATFVVYYS